MLSLIGLATILLIVIMLLRGKMTPIIALVIIPLVAALVAGFDIIEIGGFFDEGIDRVINVVIMFIFAILYFGIMQDAGLFDPIIDRMIAISRGNVIAVAVATVLIAAVAHLDGSGASTFLITIPALLPLYKRLNMNPYLLLLLVGTSASVLNMLPWAGPLGRTAAVLGMDATELWRPLIPLQIIGLFVLIGLAVLLGIREKRRIAKLDPTAIAETAAAQEAEIKADDQTKKKDRSLARPKLLWVNLLITLALIGLLVWGGIPAGFVFMIALGVALPLNYPKVKDQMERIKAHAPNALLMASIILAAGAFLGILGGTGMLDALAEDIVKVLPAFAVPYLHLIIGVFGVPFELVLNTDAYYFALLPVVEQIVTGYGVDSVTAAYALIIGNIIGTFVSPFAPALWLALGLAGLEMGKHIRYSLFWVWGYSLVLFIIAIFMGIIVI
ncbi:CitMHS family transporter [Halalkalibacterium halodurans]|uniref:CitMHS family transporter n=1 Tax=Halalkalibacterium halodurans TaxID=86665 RepID=UPI002E205879|nr:CitMHS family transporter [Halalkalibacterium halodurans]MED4084565.1 CitMHS family transporter [Halalkalibacterium halodurans]MED4104871.1 CitMHS family transporter [Halalkalibacterium halodurans]MED4109688.1 CitMHS family transporter [Halalkalibacterium halodurans]MED4147967.1 CitMHS family transporter [Halalkalibacterium halodurans]